MGRDRKFRLFALLLLVAIAAVGAYAGLHRGGGDDLPAIEWPDGATMVAGSILAAPGMQTPTLAIGRVSVPRRDLPGPFPDRVPPPRPRVEWPILTGRATADGYLVRSVAAEMAGTPINFGDAIISIGGHAILDDPALMDCVDGRRAGDRLSVVHARGGRQRESSLILAPSPPAAPRPYADYPTQFEHDLPLTAGQCGGPVVDLRGDVVGITMHRGLSGCMAIPAGSVKDVLAILGANPAARARAD